MKGRNSITDNSNVTFGLVILIIGTVWLLKTLGVMIPGWIITWPMFLIAIGIVILIKHNFQSMGGAAILFLGGFFLLRREQLLPLEVQQYLVPVALIIIGIALMFRKQRRSSTMWDDWTGLDDWSGKKKTVADEKEPMSNLQGNQGFGAKSTSSHAFGDGSDFINLEAFFCGINKRVLSKNFKGGKAFALFGGLEIDLSQADLGDSPVLDVEVTFAGLKIIMPPHWDVQLEISNIFAGVEDKRMYPQTAPDTTKVLKIKGSVIFGGLELKSY